VPTAAAAAVDVAVALVELLQLAKEQAQPELGQVLKARELALPERAGDPEWNGCWSRSSVVVLCSWLLQWLANWLLLRRGVLWWRRLLVDALRWRHVVVVAVLVVLQWRVASRRRRSKAANVCGAGAGSTLVGVALLGSGRSGHGGSRELS
jgi:hypothetical protein